MRRVIPPVLFVCVLLVAPPLDATAQTVSTTRVSVATGGAQGDYHSRGPSLNAAGRYVAFESGATNLVPGDTNDNSDVFVHDRQTGTTTRVSVATGGGQADGRSYFASLSADGRYVAFASYATNLVPGDTNDASDVFVHDRQTGTTTRVSVASGGGQANSYSQNGRISADGRCVAFESIATNLVAGDTNDYWDVFVHDRQTGTTTRVSVASDGSQATLPSYRPARISADGRYVAFQSEATNLVAGDTNDYADVFVHDRQTGTTTRVSVATDGSQANGVSIGGDITADGRYVAFASWAPNLVPGDTNGTEDVFVHDRQTGTTMRVSVATDGSQANCSSIGHDISADGRHVAFASCATNLVPGDTNRNWEVFVRDRLTGATMRVSVATDGGQANGTIGPLDPCISADGRHVAFASDATNLVPDDTNGAEDVFVRDRGARSWARDYDGDRVCDVAVFRPSVNAWYIVRSSLGTAVAWIWGTADDVPVPADYDGDGVSDVAVFRPGDGTWHVARSTGGPAGIAWGVSGDTPAPGDYDGDGKADVAVFRPSTGAWYIVRSSTGTATGLIWGDGGDLPVPADYDGDGKTDVAVFRGSTHAWYVVKSSTGTAVGFLWGDAGDVPVVADYDGDGKADVGVFRGSNHAWYIIKSTTGTGVGFFWGDTGDVPVFGDYDGDGRADVAVFRPSTGAWYIMKSTGGSVELFWGAAGDLPV